MLATAIQKQFREHDPLIRALAAHYPFAAMHPFEDGNGRTARALVALLLQRAGLRDSCFIAMSNYYYDEKTAYLNALNAVRAGNHDLTPFLLFGLRGIATQSRRLLDAIREENAKALFRNMMQDLFGRLKSPRKRVIAQRQIQILEFLLSQEWVGLDAFAEVLTKPYVNLKDPGKAVVRDLGGLSELGAIQERRNGDLIEVAVNRSWPMEITEKEFFRRYKNLPKAKTFPFK